MVRKRSTCDACDLGPSGSNGCVSSISALREQAQLGRSVAWCGPISRKEIDPETLAFTGVTPEDSVPLNPGDLAQGLISRHACDGGAIHPDVQRMADFLSPKKKKRGRSI